MSEVQTIMNHVSVGVNDFDGAVAFYDDVLAVLDAKRIMAHPGAVAYGKQFPEFWVQRPADGNPATVGNGVHFGFFARSKAEVDEFHRTALAAGATDAGAPGARPEYGAPYYGCFVLDLEGNKIEAVFFAG